MKKKFYSLFEEEDFDFENDSNDMKDSENDSNVENDSNDKDLSDIKDENIIDPTKIKESYDNSVKFNKKFRNLTEDISDHYNGKYGIKNIIYGINPITRTSWIRKLNGKYKDLGPYPSAPFNVDGNKPNPNIINAYNKSKIHKDLMNSISKPKPSSDNILPANMDDPDGSGSYNGSTVETPNNGYVSTSILRNDPSNTRSDADIAGGHVVPHDTSDQGGVFKTLGDTIKTHWKNASGTVSNWIKENPNATLGLGAGAAALGAYALWQRHKRKKDEEDAKRRSPYPVNASDEYYPYDYYSITERNYYDDMGNYLYKDDKPEDLTVGEKVDNTLNHLKFKKDTFFKGLLDKSSETKGKLLDATKSLLDKSSEFKDKASDVYDKTRKNLAGVGIFKKDEYDTPGNRIDRVISKATGAYDDTKEKVSDSVKKSAGWGLGKLAGVAERVSSWADRKRGSLNASVEYVLSEYNRLMNSKVITESYDYHPAVLEKYNEDLCNLKIYMDEVLTEAFNDPELPYEVRDEMNHHLGMDFDDKFAGCDFGPEVCEKWNSYVNEPKCASNFDKLDVIRDKCCLLNDHKLAMRICAVATAATLYFMWKKFSEHHLGMRPCEDNKMLSNVLFITGGLPNKLECCKESEDIMNNEKLMNDINSLVENEYSVMSLVMNDFSVPTIIKNTISEEFDITKYITVGTKNISENTNNVSMKKKIIF